MADFKAAKVVAALPATLEADTVYFVRVGSGFDIKVTNGTGTIVALDLNTAAGVVMDNDARLSDSREWTASTITQAEAETGTSTTRRAWTAQRVRQAIIAWWNSSSYKTKLDGVATGATANATNAQLRDRATHTGTQAISTVAGLQGELDTKANTSTQVIAGTGLSGGGNLTANRTLSVNYGTTAGTAAQGNDSRLSDSREWTADTVTQAEAEAGTASTRRAWTAQRVRQAINAWWQLVTSGFGRNFIAASSEQAARNVLQLGTAATKNVGTGSGNVMEVGAGGWLGQGTSEYVAWGYPTSKEDATNKTRVSRSNLADEGVHAYASSFHFACADTWGRLRVSHIAPHAWIQGGNAAKGTGWTTELISTDNILTTTGQSTEYPMTQKAVTDALNTKANTSTQVIAGTGLSGGGNLSANRTLSVNYGTAAGTAAQGNDSRLSDAREWTASTVSQAEAEAGTASTDRKWTAQRVRQAANSSITAQRGSANGIASLDANAKIPLSQLSDAIVGQVEYRGLWNAATNAPKLPTTPVEKGHYYVVSVSGTRFGHNFEVGDWIISNGASWDKVDNTDAVSSVNGRTGNVSGLAESDDSRFTDSREWTAATISQAEAEAGTASTRRAWTALRVRQAVAAWFLTVSTAFTRTLLGRSTAAQVRGDLELGTAATKDVGTASGNVMEVGAFGLGRDDINIPDLPPNNDLDEVRKTSFSRVSGDVAGRPVGVLGPVINLAYHGNHYGNQMLFNNSADGVYVRRNRGGVWRPWQEVCTTGNIRTTTGQSTEYPMTQKATTDAINARGFADASGILTATSGALSNDMSAFLSLKTKSEIKAWLGIS